MALPALPSSLDFMSREESYLFVHPKVFLFAGFSSPVVAVWGWVRGVGHLLLLSWGLMGGGEEGIYY